MSDSDTPFHRVDADLQTHGARAFEVHEPPATFEACWEMRTIAEALGCDITVDDVCATDESPHCATVNGETRYYQCVTDAFLLGIYFDEDGTTRTVPLTSEMELVGESDADGVVSAPEGAVLSVGVDRSFDAPDGPVTPEGRPRTG